MTPHWSWIMSNICVKNHETPAASTAQEPKMYTKQITALNINSKRNLVLPDKVLVLGSALYKEQ